MPESSLVQAVLDAHHPILKLRRWRRRPLAIRQRTRIAQIRVAVKKLPSVVEARHHLCLPHLAELLLSQKGINRRLLPGDTVLGGYLLYASVVNLYNGKHAGTSLGSLKLILTSLKPLSTTRFAHVVPRILQARPLATSRLRIEAVQRRMQVGPSTAVADDE